jgi:hypothetical protein
VAGSAREVRAVADGVEAELMSTLKPVYNR